jgi:hypothetical protein
VADSIVGMLLDGWSANSSEAPIEQLTRRVDRLEASLKQGRRK